MTPRSYAFVCVLALPIAAAIVACTAGDELAYTPASGAEAGPSTAEDAGRVVGDSSVVIGPRAADGAVLPGAAPIACTSLGEACDPSAGMGCCLKNVASNTGADNLCFEQLQHFGGSSCIAAGDVFLACLASVDDNRCCWQTEPNGTVDTRYRAACDGGVEACDPSADGGVCATGGACTSATCKGVVIGYCGGGAPPCQP